MFFCWHDWETIADEWWNDIHHLTFKFCHKCGKWEGKVESEMSPHLKADFSARFRELTMEAADWMKR